MLQQRPSPFQPSGRHLSRREPPLPLVPLPISHPCPPQGECFPPNPCSSSLLHSHLCPPTSAPRPMTGTPPTAPIASSPPLAPLRASAAAVSTPMPRVDPVTMAARGPGRRQSPPRPNETCLASAEKPEAGGGRGKEEWGITSSSKSMSLCEGRELV